MPTIAKLEARQAPTGGVPTGEFIPRQELTSLLADLKRHAELDFETIGYHAEQSDATARDGYWHAASDEPGKREIRFATAPRNRLLR